MFDELDDDGSGAVQIKEFELVFKKKSSDKEKSAFSQDMFVSRKLRVVDCKP